MQEYYNRRAAEYEQIYHRDDPLRQSELMAISDALCDSLAGRDVLEIACGTGYWTEQLSRCANSVLATDGSAEMLEIARSKGMARPTPPAVGVNFARADAFNLDSIEGTFTGGLANFWFSHVPRSRIGEFLRGFHGRLAAGAHVFMADNCYQEGVGGELVSIEGSEDTFKRRTLNDGSEHIVLKNYYDAGKLGAIFAPYARDIQVHSGRCYWWVSYSLA